MKRPVLLLLLIAFSLPLFADIPAGKELLRRADLLLQSAPLSVVDKEVMPASGDDHDYMSIARYTWPNPNTTNGLPYIHRDGQTNPEIARYDRLRLGEMTERVMLLAHAYKQTHNERYAAKAVEQLSVWFLQKDTRMNPNLQYAQVVPGENNNLGRAVGVIDAYSFVPMLESLSALEGAAAYSTKVKKALQKWFSQFADWLLRDPQALQADRFANNLAVTYDAQCIAFLRFAGREKEAIRIVRAFPSKRIYTQIRPDGSMPEEEKRTLPYHYSHYCLAHMLHVADMAEEMGYQLRDSISHEGSGLVAAMTYQDKVTAHPNQPTDLPVWQFRKEADTEWTIVRLPHSCNAIDGQSEHYYRGTTFYRTATTVLPGRHYQLLFRGAAQQATIWVNGHELLTHKGGYTPFTVDIPASAMRYDRPMEIIVCCDNRMDLTMAPVSSDFNKNNGLHDMVTLLDCSPIYIDTRKAGYSGMLVATPLVTKQEARLQVTTYLANRSEQEAQLEWHARLLDADGCCVAESRQPTRVAATADDATPVQCDLSLTSPHLWQGLSDPYLYTVELRLMQGMNLLEQRTTKVGLRHLEATADGFRLNGEPLLLRGFSYHQDRWHRASALTQADLDEDFRLIKELGCNMLRLAHYPHQAAAFDKCDEMGILVQTEIPWVNECGGNREAYSQEAYEEHLKTSFREMIIGHYNHPSIAFWGMWNELGGSHANRPQGDLDTTLLLRITDSLYHIGLSLDTSRIYGFADMGYGTGIQTLLPGKQFDYFAVNRYNGWYIETERPENGRITGGYMDYIHKRYGMCAITEYGAGCNPYCHSANPAATTNPSGGGARHDEEWFNILHEAHVREIMARPWLLFTTGWVLFDFAVADRREGYLVSTDGITTHPDEAYMYINDKGLISRDRKLCKDAFYLYKAWWNPEHTVYITSRRWTERSSDPLPIKVYSNAKMLSLYIDGGPVETLRSSGESSGLVWQFAPIRLHAGSHRIRVVGHYADGSQTEDIVVFTIKK